MRDADVRRLLKEQLDATYGADGSTRVVEELGLCRGTVRADIAVVNGSLKGYEIKSDRDTLTRLAKQVDVYSKVFDTVTIIVADRHLVRTEQIVPAWWGIELVAADSRSVLKLSPVREERNNDAVEPSALVQLLWREEVLALLNQLSLSQHLVNKPRRFLWQALTAAVTVLELKDLVRQCLKVRAHWRSRGEQTQGDAKFLPCATWSGYPSPRFRSRSRRYTYRPS